MRVLVLSDIHANLIALEAVLKDAGPADEVWCLGDLVGYGPDPNEVVDVMRAMPHLTCLVGNHDVAAMGGAVAEVVTREVALLTEVTAITQDATTREVTALVDLPIERRLPRSSTNRVMGTAFL